MRTLEKILQTFNGGILIFRFPCFESGPDLQYLFMYNISNVEITEGGVTFYIHNTISFRYTKDYKSDEVNKNLNKPKWIRLLVHEKHTKQVNLIKKYIYIEKIKVINEGIIYLPLDTVADCVIYSKNCELIKSPLEIFPSNYVGKIF
jgi:hypothetical protein